ncbi:MAG: AAA family ATPase [Candidatus Delongbacteria bacterium]|nr:AAA family ATPase [Candidatus Delongbacteria bacterium]
MKPIDPPAGFNDYIRKLEEELKAQTAQAGEAETTAPVGGEENLEEFHLQPREMVEYLNKYVIDQSEAVSILATKICTHFNRIKLLKDKAPVGMVKSNIMMIGPTGVGKTFIIKLIADKLRVPFVKGDATKFSETGYVGGDVDDLVRELVKQADGDLERASHGIIYIDEIDKIASTVKMGIRDVSGSGVQRNLLKLMEETEVNLKPAHDFAAQMEAVIQTQRTGKAPHKTVNTRNILFVVSGAFQGLTEIIRKRLSKQPMGFQRELLPTDLTEEQYLRQSTADDFIQYGFESEFIGRLPITAVLNHLDEKSLYKILQNPEAAVIRSKEIDFAAYDIEVEFNDDALKEIARLAAQAKTGARSLTRIIETTLMPYEEKLPGSGLLKLTVDAKLVEDPIGQLMPRVVEGGIAHFSRRFAADYNIELEFDTSACEYLGEIHARDGISIPLLLEGMLKDFAYGLKLMDRAHQTISGDVLRNPRVWMDRLIKESYSAREQRELPPAPPPEEGREDTASD